MEDSLLYWFWGSLSKVRGRDEPLARTLVPGRWACPDSWFSVLLPLCWSTKFKVVCCTAWMLATEEEADWDEGEDGNKDEEPLLHPEVLMRRGEARRAILSAMPIFESGPRR